jgi:hypothetical protein
LLGRVQICLVPVVYPIASTSYADFSASSRVIFVGAACSPAVGALPLSFGTSAPLASGIGTSNGLNEVQSVGNQRRTRNHRSIDDDCLEGPCLRAEAPLVRYQHRCVRR